MNLNNIFGFNFNMAMHYPTATISGNMGLLPQYVHCNNTNNNNNESSISCNSNNTNINTLNLSVNNTLESNVSSAYHQLYRRMSEMSNNNVCNNNSNATISNNVNNNINNCNNKMASNHSYLTAGSLSSTVSPCIGLSLNTNNNNDFVNTNQNANLINWTTAIQYAGLTNNGIDNTLNEMSMTNLWNTALNSEHFWKTVQNLYTPIPSVSATNYAGLSFPQYDIASESTRESFNEVLLKLGQGLNATKKRDYGKISDILRESVIPLENNSTPCAATGYPTDITNIECVDVKNEMSTAKHQSSTSCLTSYSISDFSIPLISITNTSTNTSSIIKNINPSNCISHSHVSSKLVIPPTVSVVQPIKSTISTELTVNDHFTSSKKTTVGLNYTTSTVTKKAEKKYSSSPNSIDTTIDDVLKSFQQHHQSLCFTHTDVPYVSSSPFNSISIKSNPAVESPTPEDFTNKQKQIKSLNNERKRNKIDVDLSMNISILTKPLLMSWKRETYLRSNDLLSGEVVYESPSEVKVDSMEILENVLLHDGSEDLTFDNFTFDVDVRLGDYYKVNDNTEFEKMNYEEVNALFRCINLKTESFVQCAPLPTNQEKDLDENSMLSRKCNLYLKSNFKQNKEGIIKSEKEIHKQKKFEEKIIESQIAKELKKPVEDLRLMNSTELPKLDTIDKNKLSVDCFRDCMLVNEFLFGFSEVMGIDPDTIPSFQTYQLAFIDRDVQCLNIICWLLIELLKFAVCDPGIPNNKIITQITGFKFSELEINLETLSKVLRAFIISRATEQDRAIEKWLENEEFVNLNAEKQSYLISFVVKEMMSSRMISNEIEKILEEQSILRRDKCILDGRLRRLKIIHNQKQSSINGIFSYNSASQTVPSNEIQTGMPMTSEVDSDADSIDSNCDASNLTGSLISEDDDITIYSSLEEIGKKIEKLKCLVLQKRIDLSETEQMLRGIHLGQDRYFRNYYLLKRLGGVYVEPSTNASFSYEDYIISCLNKPVLKDSVITDEKMNSVENKTNNNNNNKNTICCKIESEFNFIPRYQNAKVQSEPLDLRKTTMLSNKNECKDVTEKIKSDTNEHYKLNRKKNLEWDSNLMECATKFYVNRAKYIYTDVDLEHLKRYYRQQLEDYIRDCKQEHAVEHLKSWLNFYQCVMKNESDNLEIANNMCGTNLGSGGHGKLEKVKIIVDRELERMGKQTVQPNNTVPDEVMQEWCWIRNEEKLKKLMESLHRRGLRERYLYRTIERFYELILDSFTTDISTIFNYDFSRPNVKLKVRSKRGKGRGASHSQTYLKISLSQNVVSENDSENSEHNSKFIAQINVLEKIEDLIETVVSSSLHKKGWKFPERVAFDDTIKIIPVIQQKKYEYEMYPLDLAKERLLELEDQLERRYLLPPLNWDFKPTLVKEKSENSLKQIMDEVVSSSCGLGLASINHDDCADSTSSLLDDARSVATTEQSSTQFSIENNNESRKLSAQSNFENTPDTPPELITWRKLVIEALDEQHLLNAMNILSGAIAWDKSIMKVLCQICEKDCNEAQLLLCDACDRGYHTYCFRPPLFRIPEGAWFCHDCVSKATGRRLCCVCGEPRAARTLVCTECQRVLHAACARPPVSRVPRKWLCRNCTSRQRYQAMLTSTAFTGTASMSKISSSNISCSNTDQENQLDNQDIPCTPVTVNNNECISKKQYSDQSDEILDVFLNDSEKDSSKNSTDSSSKTPASKTNNFLGSSITSTNIINKKRKSKQVLECSTTPKRSKKRTSTKKESISFSMLESVEGIESLIPNDDISSRNIVSIDESNCDVEKKVKELKMKLKNFEISKLNEKYTKHDLLLCKKFLIKVFEEKICHPFIQPVDTKKFPIYKKVIKNPMDICTVVSKFINNLYSSKHEFALDFQLIFQNCEKFNEDDSEIGKAGHALRLFYNTYFENLVESQ